MPSRSIGNSPGTMLIPRDTFSVVTSYRRFPLWPLVMCNIKLQMRACEWILCSVSLRNLCYFTYEHWLNYVYLRVHRSKHHVYRPCRFKFSMNRPLFSALNCFFAPEIRPFLDVRSMLKTSLSVKTINLIMTSINLHARQYITEKHDVMRISVGSLLRLPKFALITP